MPGMVLGLKWGTRPCGLSNASCWCYKWELVSYKLQTGAEDWFQKQQKMCLGQRLKLADQGGLHLGGGGENRIDCGGKLVVEDEEGNGPIIPLPNPF